MDQRVIADKLERLRRGIARVKQKRPATLEVLLQDYDLQDILAVNLERAVQLCVDIAAHIMAQRSVGVPMTMAATFEELRALHILSPELSDSLKKAVGFHNIVVHSYQEIDWGIVLHICHHRLDDFRAFAQAIDTLLMQESHEPRAIRDTP